MIWAWENPYCKTTPADNKRKLTSFFERKTNTTKKEWEDARPNQNQYIFVDDGFQQAKIRKCGDPRSKYCCSSIGEGDHIKCTTTKRKYIPKSMDGTSTVTCKSKFSVYVLTCSKCGLQYVGKTIEQINQRLQNHKSDLNRKENFVVGGSTKYCNPHFKCLCPGAVMKIQPLEVYGDEGMEEVLRARSTGSVQSVNDGSIGDDINLSSNELEDKLAEHRKTEINTFLLEREMFFVKELQTVYPYGLNDQLYHTKKLPTVYGTLMNEKSRDLDISDSKSLKRKAKNFSKRLRAKKRKLEKKDNPQEIPLDVPQGVQDEWSEGIFIDELETFIEAFGWVYEVKHRILHLKQKQLKRLLNFTLVRKSDVGDRKKHMMDVIIDLCKYQLLIEDEVLPDKVIPKWRLFLNFINDGFNRFSISDILHSDDVLQLLPLDMRKDIPSTVYRYTEKIRNTILNYSTTIRKTANLDLASLPCSCKNNRYMNKDCGHVVTGDLGCIENEKLRNLIAKGPAYREKRPYHKAEIMAEMEVGLDKMIGTWNAARPKVDEKQDDDFLPWKKCVLQKVAEKLDSLKNVSDEERDDGLDANAEILKDDQCLKDLKNFHDNYVLVSADKSEGNVIVVCKRFYMTVINEELQKVPDEEGKQTYRQVEQKADQVVEELKEKMKDFKIADEYLQLAYLYWTPKMHKPTLGYRFIAASNKCVTKPLSQLLTQCLRAVQSALKHKDAYGFARHGYRRFWVTDGTKEVIARVEEMNFERTATSIDCYDFATLYTMIEHEDLLNELYNVVDEAFDYHNTYEYLIVGKAKKAQWSNKGGSKNKRRAIDRDELKRLLKLLIDNIYVTFGDKVFRQFIGIPMGTDCAPFLANLYLYAKESKWIDRLIDNNQLDLAKKMKSTLRYIDDLMAPNGGTTINEWTIQDNEDRARIYPKSLKLKKENTNSGEANFLDLTLKVNDGKLILSIYDKRDVFPFHVVSYPDLSGNISFRLTHFVILSQLKRFSRGCDMVHHFSLRMKQLTTRLYNQLFDKRILTRLCHRFFEHRPTLKIKYGLHTPFDVTRACFE